MIPALGSSPPRCNSMFVRAQGFFMEKFLLQIPSLIRSCQIQKQKTEQANLAGLLPLFFFSSRPFFSVFLSYETKTSEYMNGAKKMLRERKHHLTPLWHSEESLLMCSSGSQVRETWDKVFPHLISWLAPYKPYLGNRHRRSREGQGGGIRMSPEDFYG